MKNTRILPLAFAITAALTTTNVFAESAEAQAADGQIIDNQQPLVITPETKFAGIEFSGYARYGAHYSESEQKYVNAIGQTGNAAGRLGNEGNGGEFQFLKGFQGDNGTIWDVAVMLEHWGGNVDLKKFYASATNIFESQKQLELWAGRDFHQRPQADLNDYFWQMHDGQGAGFYNLNLGSTIMLDAAVVAQVGSDKMGDSENYALTTVLKGIDLGVGGLTLRANYGFGSAGKTISAAKLADTADYAEFIKNNPNSDVTEAEYVNTQIGYDKTIDKDASAYQVAAQFDFTSDLGWNQLVLQYTDGGMNAVFDRDEDVSNIYAHLEGGLEFNQHWGLKYMAVYNDITNDDSQAAGTTTDSRTNYNVIVRPTYQWNDTHSTWLEGGYSNVNYDEAGTNDAWKVTLSQNIAVGGSSGSRPMLRFYATYGDYNNEVTNTLGKEVKDDTFAVGAMWEAWW